MMLPPGQTRNSGVLARTEDSLVAFAALGIAILPLADIVAQQVFDSFVEGADAFAGHLTLIVGLFGAAIAARDGKLLSLATGTMLPEGWFRAWAAIFAAMAGAAASTLLAFAGATVVRVHRESGEEIARGIPVWVADLAFPIALGLIAVRLVWLSSSSYLGRSIAAMGIVAGALAAQSPEWFAGMSIWPALVVFFAATVCGMPLFGLLGGLAAFLFMAQGDDPANSLISSYGQLVSEGVRTVPLFTLAGFLLSAGRASDRLLRLFRAFFGWVPGGTAVVTTALCAFFTTFTGGSGVTILALGGLLMPALLKDGYRERFTLGLLTAAGSLGLLFAPALPLILYAVVAQVSMMQLFVGGLLPGLVMLVLLSSLGVREGLVSATKRVRFSWREAGAAVWEAKWEILMPFVIVATLMVGASITQSAALAALYALVTQRFITRDLASFGAVRDVLRDSLSIIGGVLIIMAVAVGLTSYLQSASVPDMLFEWVRAHINSPFVFLLALNGFLIVVGALMDIFAAIFVVVPLIIPIAREYGIDPIHLGIIFIANLELGYLTPPVGENLFMASYRFNTPVLQVARAMAPMWLVIAIGVLLITYWPWLTTGLVTWLGVQ